MHKARSRTDSLQAENHSAPTTCRLTVSGTISLALQAFFSTFTRVTCTLSVISEYLALPGGPGEFLRDFPCPAVLGNINKKDHIFSSTGLSPSSAELSRSFD